jgi:AraC family transcriptional regulator of adaptative response/methylated-DNA-[protein]-cysteine methyltransferase
MELTKEIMYAALLDKDARYNGQFYACVMTTGIFCRPTCTAKKPLKENVEFFRTTHEAISHGYRACKVCRPLENQDQVPGKISELIMHVDSGRYFSDVELVKEGFEPEAVRRWFRKFHGMTFHSFQRMMKINSAFKKLREGSPVASAAFDSGFESLSAFNENFKAYTGVTPSESISKNIICLDRFDTALGPMFSAATEKGICLLEFSDRKMLETEFKSLRKYYDAVIIHGRNDFLEKLKDQIQMYFKGKLKEFDIAIDARGTDFQMRVWKELQNVSYGTTRSYKQQSVALGNAGAVRAVANANGMNRIAIVIPCHRIVGDDGHLTGYGGGLWRKKWLLDHETRFSGRKSDQLQLEFAG